LKKIEKYSIDELARLIQKKVDLLQNKYHFEAIDLEQDKNRDNPQHPQVYTISNFNKFYDEDFINNAFRIIYKRTPSDDEKSRHLAVLRSGEISKTEIVVSLYFTKEAKLNNIKILGIKKRYFLSFFFIIRLLFFIAKYIFFI